MRHTKFLHASQVSRKAMRNWNQFFRARLSPRFYGDATCMALITNLSNEIAACAALFGTGRLNPTGGLFFQKENGEFRDWIRPGSDSDSTPYTN